MRRNLVWFCFFVTEKPKVQPTALFILAGKVVIEWDIKTMPTWMRVRTEEKKRRSEIHERVRKRKMEEIRYIEGNVKISRRNSAFWSMQGRLWRYTEAFTKSGR